MIKNMYKENSLEYDDYLKDIFSQHESHESVIRIKS